MVYPSLVLQPGTEHMNSEIKNTVKRCIANQKQIDVDEIALDSSLESLGVSSLDAITIIYEIEEVYNIEVPTEQLDDLQSVQEIVDGVAQLVSGTHKRA